MLDLAILGLLEERELHGYEIRRRVREQLGCSPTSPLVVVPRPQSTRSRRARSPRPSCPCRAWRPAAPPTGSLSGELAVLRARRRTATRGGRRARKVYTITDEGRRLFAELLAGGGVDDARSFGLRLAFARHLAPPRRGPRSSSAVGACSASV